MTEKIAHLHPELGVDPQALLAQVAEREGLQAVVVVARICGRWYTCWGGGKNLDNGSKSMAALTLLNDVMTDNQES